MSDKQISKRRDFLTNVGLAAAGATVAAGASAANNSSTGGSGFVPEREAATGSVVHVLWQ